MKTEWLRADTVGGMIGVDRTSNTINGYVVAQAGVFKDKRGEFDHKSLRQIERLMKANTGGTKSRLGHPTLSSDGIGTFLGRAFNPRIETVKRKGGELELVRADLRIDRSAFASPSGDIGTYLMDLAESDPEALSSSLVLQADKEYMLDSKNRPKVDDKGETLPPLWRPTAIHASDVVDTGDAADGFLGHQLNADGLRDADVRQATEMLNRKFGHLSRDEIRDKVGSWLERFLAYRFPDDDEQIAMRRREIELMELAAA